MLGKTSLFAQIVDETSHFSRSHLFNFSHMSTGFGCYDMIDSRGEKGRAYRHCMLQVGGC